METVLAIDEPGGGEYVEVRVEHEVVAKGLHGGDCCELPIGEIEADAHPVAQALHGDLEEVVEEFAALAEDAAQRAWHGEDELAVREVEAHGVGNPVADPADAALVAAGAEVAGLAGEGDELLVAATGALQAGEAGGEVAATVELVDDGHRVVAQRPVVLAVVGLVSGAEVAPCVVDDLTSSMQSGFASD